MRANHSQQRKKETKKSTSLLIYFLIKHNNNRRSKGERERGGRSIRGKESGRERGGAAGID